MLLYFVSVDHNENFLFAVWVLIALDVIKMKKRLYRQFVILLNFMSLLKRY
jgi:hypothetical protein